MTIGLVKKNYSSTKVPAMIMDAKPACMTGGKSLPAEENDRVVDILNKLLPKYKNQTGLARAIGVEQPTLSNILRRVTGSGNQTVAGIANLLGVSEYDIRTGRVTVDDAGAVVKPGGSGLDGTATVEPDDIEQAPESDHSQAYPHNELYETSYAIERYNQLARTPLFASTRRCARTCCLRGDKSHTALALAEDDLAQRWVEQVPRAKRGKLQRKKLFDSDGYKYS